MASIESIDSTTRSTLHAARAIEASVITLNAEIAALHKKTNGINDKMDTVRKDIADMQDQINDIQDMVYTLYDQSRRQHLMQMAQTQIVKVRQEREKLYGNYDKIRKTTEGILLATDVGIVRQNTIVTAAEELRLSTPKYWLSSCLVALSAWINDDKKTAERAVKEALNIDEDKTALFFALVSRRAGRMGACNQWIAHYLRSKDPERLDMRCIFMLDAYANGLLGNSSQGSVFDYMNEWVDILSQKDDFEENQIKNWSKVVSSCMKTPDKKYRAIEEFCTNKAVYIMKLQTAFLHSNLFEYIDNVMSTPVNTGLIKQSLDEILMELVTLFDDDEREKVYEEREMEYIIKFDGDEQKAKNAAQLERSRFEEEKDFTSILSDVAMGAQSGVNSPSTRKFSLAFCRDWIKSAYGDILAQNRTVINAPLVFEVNGFKFSSTDGTNEKKVLSDMKNDMAQKKNAEITAARYTYEGQRSSSRKTSIITGLLSLLFLGITIANPIILWIIAFLITTVICVYNVYVYCSSAESEYNGAVYSIESKYKNLENTMRDSIKRICADTYQMNKLVNEKNKDEKVTMRLLDELSPEMYIATYEDEKKRNILV